MKKRIEVIASLIEKSDALCDVGCDHGYVAEKALEYKRVNKVYVTDISKPSLDKAIELLSKSYPENFSAYYTDGLTGVPRAEQVVIAGMGGEEIIKILNKSAYKPVILILQPMKNTDKLRKFLHDNGYGIERDFTFFADKKYYDVMRAKLGVEDYYSQKEETYGRENLKGNPDFLNLLDKKIAETEGILSSDMQEKSKETLSEKLRLLRGLKDEIKRNL